MSTNFSDPTNFNKTGSSSIYPLHAIDSGGNFDRLEPMITPDILIKDYLFAVPLYDKSTNTRITEEDLKRVINRAISRAELDLKINIIPIRRQSKLPFDMNLFKYFGHLEIPFRPVTTLCNLQLTDANNLVQYTFPPQIIETRNLHLGQINFGPVSIQSPVGPIFSEATGFGGALILTQTIYLQSMPAFYLVDYITGFPENKIPSTIVQVIAITAAIEVMSKVSPLFRTNSQSLSHDGLSASSSGPGANLFLNRINELKEQKQTLVNQIAHYFYNRVFLLNI